MVLFNSLIYLIDQNICLDLIISSVIVFLVAGIFFLYSKKISNVLSVITPIILSIVLYAFGFILSSIIMVAVFVVIAIAFALTNGFDIKHLFIKSHQKNKKNTNDYDKEVLYQIIDETVHSLSRSKTGAIMTFERTTNLDDVMKSGTIIDAPVSQELLETIFYEGTRLHDGAVVIRGNMIIAASVYYTPTTRALQGKYGSRHRAAFGISEISDSVTVVVSEETGRVSIAYNGNLESIPLDSFLREFTDIMSITD